MAACAYVNTYPVVEWRTAELVQPQEDLDTTNREKYSEYFLFNHGTL